MQPILITGGQGFVGRHLVQAMLQKKMNFITTARNFPDNSISPFEYLDFCDKHSLGLFFKKHQPKAIIHCGAMSKADDCERKKEQALQVNVNAVKDLLHYAEKSQAHFIFLSTDFVFDGTAHSQEETATPNPVNFYGYTKLLAEHLVKNYPCKASIVRTILVYGNPLGGRQNLVSLTQQKLLNAEVFRVVDDQLRNPTFVGDLVNAILTILEKEATGIFHICGSEMMSPWQMALQTAGFLHLDKNLIQPISSLLLAEPAARPKLSGFSIEKAKHILGYQPTSFIEGLKLSFRTPSSSI